MGCNAELEVGAVVVCGATKMVVIAPATEEQAQESATGMGLGPLVVVPGERFYEVETELAPVSTN
jgi:hypothetical protein